MTDVDVEQCDRDAALRLLDILKLHEHTTGTFRAWDDTVAAFARHRGAALSSAPVVEETGWLIERAGKWWNPLYSHYAVDCAIDPHLWEKNWTDDENKAIRFWRKEDAKAVARYHGWRNVSVTETATTIDPQTEYKAFEAWLSSWLQGPVTFPLSHLFDAWTASVRYRRPVGTSGFAAGIEAAARYLCGKASEMIGSLTGDMMSRIFIEQAAAIRALKPMEAGAQDGDL